MRKLLLGLLLLLFSQLLAPHSALAAKRIEVNLTTQHLYAYQDQRLVYSFPISSGRWHPTPTGTFYPAVKLLSGRMTGGDRSIGTFYDLYNVSYIIYFANASIPVSDGYSLHGAYWHNNFGHPMSHGCVNVSPANMKGLYYWTDFSTPIIIYGVAPLS